jgi:hypothetical protein
LRVGKNQTWRIKIAFGNRPEFTSRRALAREQQIAGPADTEEAPRFGIDRVGVPLRDLHTAKLATFPRLRLPLRLDEAPEFRKSMPSFFGHSNFPGSKFKVQRSKFNSLRILER